MRLHYAKKYQQLIESCQKHLPSEIKCHADSVDLHITLQFPKHCSTEVEKHFISLLNKNNLYPVAISAYYYEQMQTGLALGFGMIPCAKIDSAIKNLAKLYRQEMLE